MRRWLKDLWNLLMLRARWCSICGKRTDGAFFVTDDGQRHCMKCCGITPQDIIDFLRS